MNYLQYFSAATYNCDAYGAGSYSENCVTVQSTDSGSGLLPDTGVAVYGLITGGVLLIVVGVVLLVRMKRKK